MPRLESEFHRDPAPAVWSLSRLLGQWLFLGLLLAALFPAARGYSEAIGWLPLWLLGAPLASLLVLHRRRVSGWFAVARTAPVAQGRLQRRRATVGQARRVVQRRSSLPARHPLRA